MKRLLFTFVSVVLVSGCAFAMFARPSLMPAERLLERTHAHLQKRPKDHKAHYVLGRIHYLAFYNRASQVAAYSFHDKNVGLPSIAPYWTAEQRYLPEARRAEATSRTLKQMGVKSVSEIPQDQARQFYRDVGELSKKLKEEGWKPEQILTGQSAEHATLALKSFDRAIDLDPENSLYLLGKASLLEQAKEFYAKDKPDRVDPILSKTSDEQIRDAYFRAYATGVKEALALEHRPAAGLRSIASYEAGKAYERLCKAAKKMTEIEKERLVDVGQSLAKLDKLRHGFITPIIFSLERNAELGDLLNPSRRVRFDLDGDGMVEEWPWVRGDTAFLVWDPARSGRILSGRQLFGSYTWQIPWENGYEPLAMLDRSGDGRLSGDELEGIRVWFDRDGDGVSDQREVVDLSTLKIESIATSGRQVRGTKHLTNRSGIRLESGIQLATWDWVPGSE